MELTGHHSYLKAVVLGREGWALNKFTQPIQQEQFRDLHLNLALPFQSCASAGALGSSMGDDNHIYSMRTLLELSEITGVKRTRHNHWHTGHMMNVVVSS